MIIYENNWDGGGGPVLKHLCVFVVRVEKKYIFQTLHVDNNQVMHVWESIFGKYIPKI